MYEIITFSFPITKRKVKELFSEQRCLKQLRSNNAIIFVRDVRLFLLIGLHFPLHFDFGRKKKNLKYHQFLKNTSKLWFHLLLIQETCFNIH